MPLESDSPVVVRWTVTLLGLLLAILAGFAIASENFLLGLIVLSLGGALAYLLFIRGSTWQLALLLCFLDFYFQPLGFRFGALELTCALGFGLFIVQLWHKRVDTTHPFFQTGVFWLFRTALALWLIYATARLGWNHLQPFLPSEYAWSNAIKSDLPVTAPILLLWLFSFRPRDIRVKPGFTNTVAVLLLGGLLVNILVRIYGITQGVFADETVVEENAESVLAVPILNMNESLYSLRFLGPAAALLGIIRLTSSHQRGGSVSMRLVHLALIFCGIAGSAISGGRSELFVAIAFCILVLALRRKLASLVMVAVATVCGFCLLNVFSGTIVTNPSLAVVQRSFYWAMMDKAESAGDSINSSSLWRQLLFNRAIEEWESNPVIFWFGRGTYKFTDEDRMDLLNDQWEAGITISLRRGATHNLVTDLLIMYGLIGLILYAFACFAIILLCFRLFTDRSVIGDVRDLALTSLITAIYVVIHGVAAGNFLPGYLPWFILIILARIAESTVTEFPVSASYSPPETGLSKSATLLSSAPNRSP